MTLLANKYVLGAVGLLIVLAGIWGYGQYQYSEGVADTKTTAEIDAAKQYKADVFRVNASIGVLQQRIEDLQNEKPKIITEYRDRVITAPLPDTCRIDTERLHHFQSAISTANATGKSQ